MLKKHSLKLFVTILVVQLLVPICMVIGYSVTDARTIAKGELFNFEISNMLIDGDRLYFTLAEEVRHIYSEYGAYEKIHVDANGFAVIELTNKKPDTTSYIKSHGNKLFDFPDCQIDLNGIMLPTHTIWMEKMSEESTGIMPENKLGVLIVNEYSSDFYYRKAYAKVYVFNGHVSVKDVYIDGVPARECITKAVLQYQQKNSN